MTPRQILSINASATAVTALAMLATRSTLAPLFGLTSPHLLDVTAISFLVYAGALGAGAVWQPIPRELLLAFAAIDAAWVAFSALLLLLFWPNLTPIARALIIAVALIVDVFATLQWRAAGSNTAGLKARATM